MTMAAKDKVLAVIIIWLPFGRFRDGRLAARLAASFRGVFLTTAEALEGSATAEEYDC